MFYCVHKVHSFEQKEEKKGRKENNNNNNMHIICNKIHYSPSACKANKIMEYQTYACIFFC